jgi:hypothetical protein
MSESENKFYCDVCKKSFSNVSALNKHFKTATHIQNESNIETDENDLIKTTKGKTKVKNMFYCPLCQYETDKKDFFLKHINTKRHEDNEDKYKENIEDRADYDKLDDLLTKLSIAKIKIGLVKEDGEYMEVSADDIDELFKMDEVGELKKISYPKSIKQVKKNEVSLEKQKQEKKQLKIKDLEKIIKTQMDIIEKNNKQMEKYKKTNNPDDMTYNLSELARVKKGLKQNLDKLEKLEK